MTNKSRKPVLKNRKLTFIAPLASNEANAALTNIPLQALAPSSENVRRFQSEAGLTELAASIRAHGLLQNLTVRQNGEKYEVVAGARRFAALKRLAGIEGSGWTMTSLIPVKLLGLERDAEISLAENAVRENMHTADQVAAFCNLIEKENMTPEQVGDRFGLSHMTVRRRVKLAKVSPKIMDDFRDGHVTLQELEALAVSDDHGEQENALASLTKWNRNPEAIRSRLTSEKIPALHRLAEFIGVDAYCEAGGTIISDLFSDETSKYLDNKALVLRLVDEKMAAFSQAIQREENWKWSEYYLSEHDARPLPSIASSQREFTDAEDAELTAIYQFMAENEAAYEAEQLTEDEKIEVEAKLKRINEIDEGLISYDPVEQSYAGIRVYLSQSGSLAIKRGLLKLEDQHSLVALKRSADLETQELEQGHDIINDANEPVQEPEAALEMDIADGYSASLISDLTAYRTTALAYCVSQRPDVALALAVHAMGVSIFYPQSYCYPRELNCAAIFIEKANRKANNPDPDNASAETALNDVFDRLKASLPEEMKEFLSFCLEAPRKQLMDLLAYCVGLSVNTRADTLNSKNVHLGNELALLVDTDMQHYWKPSEGFLKRISKAQIAQAVMEAGSAPEIAKSITLSSKADAIWTALEAFEGQNWLSPALRNPLQSVEYPVTEASLEILDADLEENTAINTQIMEDHAETVNLIAAE